MTPKNRLNQTKIKLKFDNKKVKLADKKRPKKKEEPKKESLVVKLAKPMIMPPGQAGPDQDNPQLTPTPLTLKNSEEIEILQMIDEYNERKWSLFRASARSAGLTPIRNGPQWD